MSRIELGLAGLFAVGLGAAVWGMSSGPPEGERAPRADSKLSSSKGSDPTTRTRPRERGQVPASGDLEGRVARLEAELAALRRELKTQNLVRGAVAAESSGARDGQPGFETAVRDILETDRDEQQEQQTEARRSRWTDRRDDILADLRTAGLSEADSTDIGELWSTESDLILPLIMQARSGEANFGDVREQAKKVRAETDKSVQALLTAAEFEIYQEHRPQGPGRRRR